MTRAKRKGKADTRISRLKEIRQVQEIENYYNDLATYTYPARTNNLLHTFGDMDHVHGGWLSTGLFPGYSVFQQFDSSLKVQCAVPSKSRGRSQDGHRVGRLTRSSDLDLGKESCRALLWNGGSSLVVCARSPGGARTRGAVRARAERLSQRRSRKRGVATEPRNGGALEPWASDRRNQQPGAAEVGSRWPLGWGSIGGRGPGTGVTPAPTAASLFLLPPSLFASLGPAAQSGEHRRTTPRGEPPRCIKPWGEATGKRSCVRARQPARTQRNFKGATFNEQSEPHGRSLDLRVRRPSVTGDRPPPPRHLEADQQLLPPPFPPSLQGRGGRVE
ncbi:hypothetical protein NDU88_000488 [Pleurodeles waltl]|uniref:Uncharacterized protein n=1 Tax=Pleurodeles waltl TaxID=8319 RepID=A0AAV7NHD5_PLEWA|nr:hypothetical protein NDU88_000488 [Pleurodeles waltl]